MAKKNERERERGRAGGGRKGKKKKRRDAIACRKKKGKKVIFQVFSSCDNRKYLRWSAEASCPIVRVAS